VLAVVFGLILCTTFSILNGQTSGKLQAPSAPQAVSCTLRGNVFDPSGAVIHNAQVSLKASTGLVEQQTSSPGGGFCFSTVGAGDYTLSVSMDGFAPSEQQVHISSGKTVSLDVHLKIAVEQIQMDVSSDSTDETDPSKNGDAIILKGKAIDELPTEPSQLQQELQGMSGGDAPSIYVDGFSNGTIPPKNTIREIRINQNPYSAENDTDPSSGMIQIFTKPGTDKLHGDFLLFGNDSAFNTQNPFVQNQPPYHSLQINGDVNGPINKKASYFLSFTRRGYQTNSVVNAEILDPSDQNQIVFSQAIPSPTTFDRFGSRVDFQLGSKSTVTANYAYTNSGQINGGVGQLNLAAQAFNSSAVTQLLQLSNSQVFGAKVVNDTRFQYLRTRTNQTPVSSAPTLIVQGAFTDGGSSQGAFRDNQDSYELQNYLAIQAGKHYLSPGVRLRVHRDANVSQAGYNGEFTFSGLDAYQVTLNGIAQGLTPDQIAANGGGPSQFSLTAGTPRVTIDVVDLGAFYQDDWKVNPHFTLSYGLRYEIQNYISDRRDFAPRVGFAWSLGAKKNKPPQFVVRGGSGIFYARLLATSILNSERQNGIVQQQYVVASPNFYPNVPTPSTLGPQNLSTIYRISPKFRSPYGFMSSIGVDHPLGSHGSISVQYFYNRGNHVLVTRNINAPLPGTYNPEDPTSGNRPLGTTQNIYEYDSAGIARTNRLSVNGNFRTKNEFGAFGFYQFRHRNSDANGFASNSYDLAADYGRAPQDVRHQLFLSVNSPLLYRRIHVGAYMFTNSGLPFNITLGQDLNGDSQFNDRPAFATDLTRPSVVRTPYGIFDTSPIPGQTIIPVNYGQSPGLVSMSAELYREFTFGPAEPAGPTPTTGAAAPQKANAYIQRRYNLTFAIEAENVINHVNLGPPVGVLGSPLFGKSIGLNGGFGSPNANRVINLVLFARF
jgi:hypothetical protein